MEEVLVDMEEWTLGEISGVNVPMNALSDAVLTKQAEQPDTEPEGSPEAAPAAKGADNMAEETKEQGLDTTALKALQDEVAKLTKQGQRQDLILSLPADQRAYHDGLAKAEQDAYLAGTDEERAATITTAKAAAEDQDPVVYTSTGGQQYRKSDAPVVVAQARQIDGQQVLIEKMVAKERTADFTKRAETEFAAIPADTDVMVAVLEKIAELPEATRTAAETALKSHAGNMLSVMAVHGTDALQTVGAMDASLVNKAAVEAGVLTEQDIELEKRAAERLKLNPALKTFEKAYAEELSTPEGQQLYYQRLASLQ